MIRIRFKFYKRKRNKMSIKKIIRKGVSGYEYVRCRKEYL